MLIAPQRLNLLIWPCRIPHREVKILRQWGFAFDERAINSPHQFGALRMPLGTNTEPRHQRLRQVQLANTRRIEVGHGDRMLWIFDLRRRNGLHAHCIEIPIACKSQAGYVFEVCVVSHGSTRSVRMRLRHFRRQTLPL
ncbi:hypothetical protein AQ906_04300 [Burkholderia pseudomallei]|nr:hypothetical protein AQ906_04300 [Burkholderia pseudomallei]